MAIENVNNFRGARANLIGKASSGQTFEYEDALRFIQKKLEDLKSEEVSDDIKVGSDETIKKDKSFLKEKRDEYRQYIEDIVNTSGFKVIGYSDNMEQFIDEMVEETVGFSVLSDAMNDDEISDIFILKWDKIYVERDGVNELYPKKFKSEGHFNRFMTRILQVPNVEINSGDKKIVDFEVYGDRGNAIDKSVSVNGTSLTLRKHSESHITRDQLVGWNVLTEEMSDFLGMLIQGEANMICAGLTGSGKTTTLRALLDYYVPAVNKRMLVCEDTQELFPTNDHTLELISTSKTKKSESDITLNDLILTALRQKPKYIVVGEVRGLEAEAAVEAMETGHSTLFTMHGGKVWNVINRLVTKYITAMPSLGKEVVERIVGSAVDYVFIQSNIPGIGRKVTEIVEVDYDYDKNIISTKTIFKYNLIKKDWIQMRGISMDKASKIMERGVPVEQVMPWIEKTEDTDDSVEIDILETNSLTSFQVKCIDILDKNEISGILNKQLSIIRINIYNFTDKLNYDIESKIKSQLITLEECVKYSRYMGFDVCEDIDRKIKETKGFSNPLVV